MIAGKGHEQGQELADGREDALRRRGGGARGACARATQRYRGSRCVIGWDAERVAAAAGAELLRGATQAGAPRRWSIDSREVQPGDLFVGLRGEHVDGGAYAEQALRAGAWGVLVAPEHADALASTRARAHAGEARRGRSVRGHRWGAVLAHPDPLAAMQSLARDGAGRSGRKAPRSSRSRARPGRPRRRTSSRRCCATRKDGSWAAPTVASPANLNTEIGLPLAVLAAPAGTKALVLEMAMRGKGQIAELTAIAQPEVGVIVNVGPVHLEQLGTIEAVAAAKAELIAGMARGATAVVPAGEPLLEPHLRADQHTVTFGEGGDVELVGRAQNGEVTIVDHARGGRAHRACGHRSRNPITCATCWPRRRRRARSASPRTGGWMWSSRRCAANASRWQTESC